MKRFFVILILIIGFCGPSASRADAMLIDFNFNSLLDEAGKAAVQLYMNNLLNVQHPGGHVVVGGAKAEQNYFGDGHVVGPVINVLGATIVFPLTLGDTDAGVPHTLPLDTYLINGSADRITLNFDFPIYSLSFDYEIFPDGTCPNGDVGCQPTSVNWPDFTFKTDDLLIFRTLGINPNVGGPFQHSPFSGPILNEHAPQFLGSSGEYLFPDGVRKLEFIDWPRLIGIDNLVINDRPPVPEPASIFLLTTGLLSFAGFKRKPFSKI